MALKDWRRGKPMKNGSVSYFPIPNNSDPKSYTRTEIIKYISIFPSIKDSKGNVVGWSVETRFKHNDFKSKPQALAFAKKYMRTH